MFKDQQAAIVARLEAKLDSSIKVVTLDQMALVPELQRKAPAVFVIFDGFDPAESANGIPHVARVRFKWALVVATRSAAGGGDTAAAKAQASDIAAAVLGALLGFQVSPGERLQLAASAGDEYEGGFCYLPIGFSSFRTFKGEAV